MFWSPADGRRSRGELSSDDRWFNLKLTSDVVTSLTHSVSHPGSETMVGITREPALVVADFEPRVLHGELGDGTAVTILDGHLDSGPFGEQSFSAHRLIWGAHLPESPTFSSVRFAPPGQRGWHGLVGEASCGGAIPRGRLKLAIKPGYAAFLIAGYRVRRSRRVPFGRPGPGVRDFGGLAGVPSVGASRRNPLRTRAGVSRPGLRRRSQGSRRSSTRPLARRSWV